MNRKFEFTQSQYDTIYIDLQLDTYRNYIHFVESHIKNTIEKTINEFEEKIKKKEKYSEEYINHIEGKLEDNLIQLEGDFKQSFRTSIIIQLFSFLEKKLITFCDSYTIKNNKEYSVKDLKGNNDLDKIKKYLIKSVNIEISELNPEWSYLNNLRKLRNCIVHQNSKIKQDDTNFNSLNSFKTNHYKLNIFNEDIFEIELDNKDFLLEITNKIYNLFLKLSDHNFN